MAKLIIETQEPYTTKEFNYDTAQMENIKHEKEYYFTIVANTKEEAIVLYDEIHKLFKCSLCPSSEESNSDYDDKYTIEDSTQIKIDKRKLRKYL